MRGWISSDFAVFWQIHAGLSLQTLNYSSANENKSTQNLCWGTVSVLRRNNFDFLTIWIKIWQYVKLIDLELKFAHPLPLTH